MGCKFDLRAGFFTQYKTHSRVNGFQGSHVSGWRHGFMGEYIAIGSLVYQVTPRPSIMYQRYPQSCVIPVSVFQVLRDHLQWWTNFSSLKEGPLLRQKEHNLLLFVDAFFKGWDAQLMHQTAIGLWYHEESRLHINRVTSFRIIRQSASESKSVDFHRQFISGCLSEQAGRYPLSGNLCLNLENQGLGECQEVSDSTKTHPRVSASILPDSLSRKDMMIQIERFLNHMFNHVLSQICH